MNASKLMKLDGESAKQPFQSYLSRIMGKLGVCLFENKGADQLCSNCTADLCFRYTASTILYTKFQASNLFVRLVEFGQFVSDLVGNPEEVFSCVISHLNQWYGSQLATVSTGNS